MRNGQGMFLKKVVLQGLGHAPSEDSVTGGEMGAIGVANEGGCEDGGLGGTETATTWFFQTR